MRRDYIQSILQEDEQVIYRCRAVPARYPILSEILGCFELLLDLRVVILFIAFPLLFYHIGYPIVLYLVIAFYLYVILRAAIWYRYVHSTWEMVITDRRIITVFGLLSKSINEVELSPISGISVYQNFLGRVFNYGWLSIFKNGLLVFRTFGIYDPIKVRLILDQAIEADRERKARIRHEINRRIKGRTYHSDHARLIEAGQPFSNFDRVPVVQPVRREKPRRHR